MRIALVGLRAIGECSGGIERHVEELAVRMARTGHEVTVFCRERYNTISGGSYQGVRLRDRPALYSKHLEAITHTAACLPSLLTGYDVIHFHATGPSLLSWVPRLFGQRVVVTVHGLDYLRAKWGGAATLVLRAGALTAVKCPHRTIVVSKTLQEHYRRNYGTEVAYIPNGVNPPEHRPLRRLERFDLREKGYVLFLGRLVPEKGAHHLIAAFRKLNSDLKLAIAGGSSHSDSYTQQLRDLAAGDDRIVFTGPLFGADKDEAFSNARAFVLPSELEGMPIVLLEAMSYGCPTLLSDIPECMEVLPQCGREVAATFRSQDSYDLSERLAGLLARPDLENLGTAARAYVLAQFDWDAITQSTLAVYAQACGLKPT